MENKLQVIIEAVDKATGVLRKISKETEKSFSSIKNTGEKLKDSFGGIALGVSGIGIAGVKMAMDFDKSMSNVSTLIDTTKESMSKMKKEVLDLANKTPVALSDLTSALYDVRSAGVDAKNAMNVLNSSAKLAVAGLGSTKDAVNLMTSAFNAFAKQGYSADQIANILFKTVKNGKTTVAQLSQGFGALAGLASTVGVDFKELMASTAALTTTGLSASEAYTGLKAILTSVVNPTKQAAITAKKLGIDFSASALKAKGLSGFLQEVKEKTHGNTEVMAQLFGNVEALNAVLSLTGSNAEAFSKTMQDIGTKANGLDEAFKKQNQTFWATWNILKNKLTVVLIQIGEKITPILQSVIEWTNQNPELTKTILEITAGIVGLAAILGTLGIAITAITSGLSALGVAFTVLTGPIGLTIAAIASLSYAGYQLVKHWDEVKTIFSAIWESIKVNITTTLTQIKQFIQAILEIIINIVKMKFYDMYQSALIIIQLLQTTFEGGFTAIKDTIKTIFDQIKAIINGAIKWVVDKVLYLKRKLDEAIALAKKIASYTGQKISQAGHAVVSAASSAWNSVKSFAGFKASGGEVKAANSYIVGERGPEVFVPSTNGTIVPNGGSAPVININFGGVVVKNEADENRLVEKIKDALTSDMILAKNYNII